MEVFITIMCILLPIIAVTGTFGNFSIVAFYWKTRKRIISLVYILLSSIHLLLSCAALAHLVTFVAYPSFTFPYTPGEKPHDLTNRIFMVIHVLLFGWLHRLAAFVNCTLSVMRSVNICYPFYRVRKGLILGAVVLYSLFLTSLVVYFVIGSLIQAKDDNNDIPNDVLNKSMPADDMPFMNISMPAGPSHDVFTNITKITTPDSPKDLVLTDYSIQKPPQNTLPARPPKIQYTLICVVLNQCVVGATHQVTFELYYMVPFVIPSVITFISFIVSFLGILLQRRKNFKKKEIRQTVTILLVLCVFLSCNLADIVFLYTMRNRGIRTSLMKQGIFFQMAYVFETMVVFVEAIVTPLILIMRSKSLNSFLFTNARQISSATVPKTYRTGLQPKQLVQDPGRMFCVVPEKQSEMKAASKVALIARSDVVDNTVL